MKGKGGSGYATLTRELLKIHTTVDIPLIRATPRTLSRYGSLLHSKDEALSAFRNETWIKQGGWRGISESTGNEALPAIGTFEHYWAGYDGDFRVCCAKNEAVSRSYETALCDVANRHIFVREMNYHLCGNQLIVPLDTANQVPFIALLARSKEGRHADDIDFDDMRAFFFDGSCGLNIFAKTWHQPSFPYHVDGDQNAKMFNVQSSVHSCVVYDSLDEHEKVMRITLPANTDLIKGDEY